MHLEPAEEAGGPDAGGGGCSRPPSSVKSRDASTMCTARQAFIEAGEAGAGAEPAAIAECASCGDDLAAGYAAPLSKDVLLFLLATSEHRVRELEDMLAEEAQRHMTARYRAAAAPRSDEVPAPEGLSLSVGFSQGLQEREETYKVPPLAPRAVTSDESAERRSQHSLPQESVNDSFLTLGSTTTGNEAISLIRESLLQLEPVSRGEELWKNLGDIMEELKWYRSRVAEQSKKNQRLRREVDEQRAILTRIADLELQHRLFASRVPQGLALLEQGADEFHTMEEVQMIDNARQLWDQDRLRRKDCDNKYARLQAALERERADRNMLPMLQRKIDETREATKESRTRMQAIRWEFSQSQAQQARSQSPQRRSHSPQRRSLSPQRRSQSPQPKAPARARGGVTPTRTRGATPPRPRDVGGQVHASRMKPGR
mmetsp:Transcript_129876/g.250485  ORF Transcript_129876/g.250485 Transcript_129876/m.250485 type:complete len:429 (-) Transcript_129876:39-1325(-)